MKREIKFRAWNQDTNLMFYTDQDQTVWAGGKRVSVNTDKGQRPGTFIGMQFTGLKDKNGKEIYEGDVLEMSSWEEGKVRIAVAIPDIYIELHQHAAPVEVIGNIYENPELVKN